jgi:cell division protease FtsH
VKKLINEQYLRAKALLSEHAAKHGELAELLINKEVIFTEDVERIFGKRPWKSRADELMEEEQKDTIQLDEAHTSSTLDIATDISVETKEETTNE